MNDLNSALDSAFEEERDSPGQNEAAPAAPEPEPAEASEPEAEAKPESAAQPAPADDEPTGDVLLDKLTPDQIAELKKDPRLRSIYKGLMSSYTPKMQQFAEQARLWEALNNQETRRGAVEALARAVGLEIKPTDEPQREQARQVSDQDLASMSSSDRERVVKMAEAQSE